MAKKIWEVLLEDGVHTVELDHGFISGRKEIRVDGQPLPLPESAQSMADFGGDFPFAIGRHEGVVHIRTNGLTFSYDLSMDGRSVETGEAQNREETTRRRRLGRMLASGYAVIAGVLCIVFGDRFRFMGIPLLYVGIPILIVGLMGFLGVNVFYGGPLDQRNDPPPPGPADHP